MTREFVRRASEERPEALVCEGTRMDPEDSREDLSEKDVQQRAQKLISSSKKLSIVSFYPKDVDRMRTFRDVAKATGRRFVVSAKVANLLEAFRNDSKIDVPDPLNDPSMLVYVRKMAKPEKVRYELKYVKLLGSSDHVVDSEFVRTHQDQLMLHTDFFQLAELIDIKPEPGSLFIRSKSEPFEEDDVQEEVLMNWIDWFKLDFHQAHASGHASRKDIFAIIEEISPKMVIPVHTQHAAEFHKCGFKVECPVARKCINVC
jgi:ribonuclease J